jgi:hypothetical protein
MYFLEEYIAWEIIQISLVKIATDVLDRKKGISTRC